MKQAIFGWSVKKKVTYVRNKQDIPSKVGLNFGRNLYLVHHGYKLNLGKNSNINFGRGQILWASGSTAKNG